MRRDRRGCESKMSLQKEVQTSGYGNRERQGNSEVDEIEENLDIVELNLKFVQCPIQTTLQVLGKKWTLLILRDIGFRRVDRFSRLLETVSGITPRVLSMRLKELEETGYIKCVEKQKRPMIMHWNLTQKGRDTLPILLNLLSFGSKWYPEVVFRDLKTRSRLNQIFTRKEMRILNKYS